MKSLQGFTLLQSGQDWEIHLMGLDRTRRHQHFFHHPSQLPCLVQSVLSADGTSYQHEFLSSQEALPVLDLLRRLCG